MSKSALYLAALFLALISIGIVVPASAELPIRAPCLLNGAIAKGGGNPSGETFADRMATLARGVNVTDLFGDGNVEPLEPLFRHLRLSGIRHVRIPVSPRVFAPDPPAWQNRVLARLDQVVCAAIATRLGVVIDLHPTNALEPVVGTNEQIADRLSAAWLRLASRYANASPNLVFFEVLNEPKFPDGREWERLQSGIVFAIRSVAPRNTLILTASPWSEAASLSAMTPIADRNVAYAFHTYTPMIFTHQGAPWSLPSYASIVGLAFPANAQNVLAVASHTEAARQEELAAYGRDFVNDQRIISEIDAASAWARRYGVAVVATEFGVDDKAPPPARAAWLATVRRSLEARGIGWTVWEYRGGFGIATDLQRGCAASDSAAKALGLCGE